MKILVLSDSHQIISRMADAVELERPDYVIHLGDCTRDAEDLRRLCPKLPLVCVRGNCDFGSIEEDVRVAEYDGVRIFMTHGHLYGVKSGLMRCFLAAKEKQAHIALFGHTHCPYCDCEGGIWMVNPGSCGPTAKPTYALIEIQSGIPQCSIHTFD